MSQNETDMKSAYGPWAVITGASDGTGAEFARQLAAQGINLVLIARRQDPLDELAESIRDEHGVETRTASVDLYQASSADDVVAAEEGHRGIRANGVAIGWIEKREWARSFPGDTVVSKPETFDSIEDHINSILHQISDMTRIPRIGRPEEAGNLFAFLASNEASYVNGQVIAIDGGSSL